MLTITDAARELLYNKMRSAGLGEGYAVRLKILGRTLSGFKYDFRTVPSKERAEDDLVIELGEFPVYLDSDTVQNLEGAVIDVKPEGGLKIDNPNPVLTSDLQREVAKLLEAKINPGVGIHGGEVLLVDIKDHTAYVNMEGGCKGCGMARTTFRLGIEKMIREAVPAIESVIDITEHEKGLHPFYAPNTTGESPLQNPDQ